MAENLMLNKGFNQAYKAKAVTVGKVLILTFKQAKPHVLIGAIKILSWHHFHAHISSKRFLVFTLVLNEQSCDASGYTVLSKIVSWSEEP